MLTMTLFDISRHLSRWTKQFNCFSDAYYFGYTSRREVEAGRAVPSACNYRFFICTSGEKLRSNCF